MTVKALIELAKTESFNIHEKLNVKTYIPVMSKKILAMDVIAECTDDFDGFIEVDRFKMDIYFDMCALARYTNLEVSFDFDTMIKEYDQLNEIGIFDLIIGYFRDDYRKCKSVLIKELESFLAQNSVEAQVVKIANKVNALLDEIGDKFGAVDLNSIITDGVNLGELMETIRLLK